jgi:hypothetical protein
MEEDEHAEQTKKNLFAIGLKTLAEMHDKKPESDIADSKEDLSKKSILSPYRSKMIPPLKPSKDFSVLSLQNITEQFLCTECCSHRIVRIGSAVAHAAHSSNLYSNSGI